MEGAREVGGNAATLARSAAEGAVEAADRISTAAGRAVRRTLGGTVAGVRDLLDRVRGAAPPAERPTKGAPPARPPARAVARRAKAPRGGRRRTVPPRH